MPAYSFSLDATFYSLLSFLRSIFSKSSANFLPNLPSWSWLSPVNGTSTAPSPSSNYLSSSDESRSDGYLSCVVAWCRPDRDGELAVTGSVKVSPGVMTEELGSPLLAGALRVRSPFRLWGGLPGSVWCAGSPSTSIVLADSGKLFYMSAALWAAVNFAASTYTGLIHSPIGMLPVSSTSDELNPAPA